MSVTGLNPGCDTPPCPNLARWEVTIPESITTVTDSGLVVTQSTRQARYCSTCLPTFRPGTKIRAIKEKP